MLVPHLLILGLGYSGSAVARAALADGFRVTGTRRTPEAGPAPAGVRVIGFDDAAPCFATATHVLATAAPGPEGDPVLARHGAALRAAERLVWIGYLSSTGVYGDHGGAWVDEETPPAPANPHSIRRLHAEQAWRAAARGRSLDIFRLAGIYGPGRSALEEVRARGGRRVIRPGHVFGRIHRDDIAAAVLAAMRQEPDPGVRVFNLCDDAPAERAAVLEEAARLLGLPPPPAVPFEDAFAAMSPMAREFWSDRRRVSGARTKAALGLAWRYPTYREGLAAILAEEGRERPAEQ